jgi:hypothetical protein
VCKAASCFDTKLNQNETDVDCGGTTCALRCDTGQKCLASNDCVGACNLSVTPHLCLAASCTDGKQNQDETDADCGGLTCTKRCDTGQKCVASSDCVGICNLAVTPHVCKAASCTDGKLNQDETDVDCGGTACTKRCALLQKCVVDGDCAGGICSAGHCHQLSFASPSPMPIATAYTLAVGDLDGDHKPDIVAPDNSTGTLVVKLGNGDKTFRNPPGLPPTIGPAPRAVLLAQLDDDTNLDAVVLNNDKTLSFFKGGGDGTFAPRVDYTLMNYGFNIAVGEFSGDTALDIAAVTYGLNFTIMVNNGKGLFTAKNTYAASGGFAAGIASGLLDDDSINDIVTGGGGQTCVENGFYFYPGKGDSNGTFGTMRLLGLQAPCGNQAYTMEVADMNHDGKPDIVTGAFNVYPLRVWKNDGGAVFSTYTESSTVYPTSLALADFDGDGVPDVVSSSQSVTVVLNRGDASFRAPFLVAPSGYGASVTSMMRSVATGDFNTDTKPDIVTTDGNGSLYILYNTSQ